jgi:DnaK suppressor protein
MSKAKARKTVKAAKATKPAKPVKVHQPVKASKPVKMAKAVKAKAPQTVSRKPLRPQPGKRPHIQKPVVSAAPEAEAVIKTIKWSAAELKQFRERLQRLHDVVVDDIGFLAGGHLANSADGVAGKPSGGSQDRTEDGTENFAQDLSLMQVSNKQDMLNEIIDAFRRLDLHTYGLCEECGGLVAEARLNAQPFATRCIKCQSAAEANRPRSQGFRKSMVQIVDMEPS